MTATIHQLRPDYTRRAFDLIDSLHETGLSNHQREIVEAALSCLEKAIEVNSEQKTKVLPAD
jgi:phage baseplate assembly protein W